MIIKTKKKENTDIDKPEQRTPINYSERQPSTKSAHTGEYGLSTQTAIRAGIRRHRAVRRD